MAIRTQAPRSRMHHHRHEIEFVEREDTLPLGCIAKRRDGVRQNRIDVALFVSGARLRSNQLFSPIKARERDPADFIEYNLRADACKMVVNALALRQFPFIKGDGGALAP